MLLLEASVTHKGLVKVANGDWLEWEQLFWGGLFSPEWQWSQRNLLRQWSCAPFYTTWLYLCWVRVCQVTTSRPTQTQGHTHYDTVETVWLGSRSTSKWEEGGGWEEGGDHPHPKKSDWCLCPSILHHLPPMSPHLPQIPIHLTSSPNSVLFLQISAKLASFLWNCTKSVSILNLLGVPCIN